VFHRQCRISNVRLHKLCIKTTQENFFPESGQSLDSASFDSLNAHDSDSISVGEKRLKRYLTYELLRWLVEMPSRDVHHYRMMNAPRSTVYHYNDTNHYNDTRSRDRVSLQWYTVTWRSVNKINENVALVRHFQPRVHHISMSHSLPCIICILSMTDWKINNKATLGTSYC